MKNQKVFDDIKLRAGYGVTGSQPSQSFLGVPLLGYGDYYLYNGQWIRALQPTQNSNDKLKWEEKHEYDIGADFSILNYRLNVSVDWYYRLIKGLLYDYSVPSPPNLYTTTRANVGEMSNNGLEIMVNAIPVRTKDFKWETTITFSTNSNKLKSLSNDLYQTSSDYFMTGWIEEPIKTESHIVRIGHKVGDIYGFKVVDVDESGKWIYLDKNGNRVNYDDFTHSFEDKQILGNGVPNGILVSTTSSATRTLILPSICEEPLVSNSYYVENGDYWKIDNITLGYSFSKINKWIKTLRLYASVNNAITITGYKGIDPEVSTSGLAPSYDNRDSYPHTRAFTFGMNVTF